MNCRYCVATWPHKHTSREDGTLGIVILPVMSRERAEAIVEASDDFIVDAWDAAATERPDRLTGAVVDWFRGHRLYERHVEDLMDGTVEA